jgi:hypothetical protein
MRTQRGCHEKDNVEDGSAQAGITFGINYGAPLLATYRCRRRLRAGATATSELSIQWLLGAAVQLSANEGALHHRDFEMMLDSRSRVGMEDES